MRLFPTLISLALIGGAPAAGAARTKLAVMPLNAQGVDERITTILDSLLAVEVDNLGRFEVVGAADIKAVLGLDGLKQSLGCTETSCAAELGGALGVDLMVSGVLGRLGDSILINAMLIDVKSIKTLKRTSVKMPNDENVFDRGVAQVVQKLFADLPASAYATAAPGASKPAEPKASGGQQAAGSQPGAGGSTSTPAASTASAGRGTSQRAANAGDPGADLDLTSAPASASQPLAVQADPAAPTGISNAWWIGCAGTGALLVGGALAAGLTAKASEAIAREALDSGAVNPDHDLSPQQAAQSAVLMSRVSTSLWSIGALLAAAALPLYLFARPWDNGTASAAPPAGSAAAHLGLLPLPGGGLLVSASW